MLTTEQVQGRLHDIWALERLGEKNKEQLDGNPYLELNLTTWQMLGNDGCNEFQADILNAGSRKLRFGPLSGTEKACLEADSPEQFRQALAATRRYRREGLKLFFYGQHGQELLVLRKVD